MPTVRGQEERMNAEIDQLLENIGRKRRALRDEALLSGAVVDT